MEIVLGNIFIRQGIIDKRGEKVEGHTHKFDHVTYINRGTARITRTSPEGETKSKVIRSTDPYNYVLILKTHTHVIEALKDNTVYHCVYAHREPDTGEVTVEYNGWDDAYQ